MNVLGLAHVDEFSRKHASNRACLNTRVAILKDKAFMPKSHNDMKDKFGRKFDVVSEKIVLDCCGNNVRIIGRIDYGLSLLFIIHVLTHKEYDKGKWK